MKIDDYINNGKVARSQIALDIKRRVISRSDIEQIISDKRIQAVFLNEKYDKKVPKKDWNKSYLNVLTSAAIAESFNRDYLLYLDEVADHVAKKARAIKIIIVGAIIIILIIIAGVVVKKYIVKNSLKELPDEVTTYITETNLAVEKVKKLYKA